MDMAKVAQVLQSDNNERDGNGRHLFAGISRLLDDCR
jgi:hypothetical protein